MALGAVNTLPASATWDDPLILLPRRKPQFYEKDRTIFTPEDRAESLFLVVDGTVKLSRISDGGRETVLDFCPQDSFFGESSLMGRAYRGEMAVALEDTSVMEWPADELVRIMLRTPELGPSLLRVLATKLYEADSRIESLAIDQISQRLVRALLRLGERFGDSNNGVSKVHLMPITHELLAKYVGTSREIVTQHMSQLRRKGVLDYSRAGIEFEPSELRKALRVR
jgi:CRP/FNR family transcriptional regulator